MSKRTTKKLMKKISVLVFATVLLVGCGSGEKPEQNVNIISPSPTIYAETTSETTTEPTEIIVTNAISEPTEPIKPIETPIETPIEAPKITVKEKVVETAVATVATKKEPETTVKATEIPIKTPVSTPKVEQTPIAIPSQVPTETVKTEKTEQTEQTEQTEKKEQTEKMQNVVKISIVSDDKSILKETEVEIEENETVFQVMKRVTKEKDIAFDYKGSGKTSYVMGIDDLYEFDLGAESGWMYFVNGESPSVSSGTYKLKKGDSVVWRYVLKAKVQ